MRSPLPQVLRASALHEHHDNRFYDLEGAPIDWVICGGESGPKARPCHIDWIRSIVRQCREAGVPCFVKQLAMKIRQARKIGVGEVKHKTRTVRRAFKRVLSWRLRNIPADNHRRWQIALWTVRMKRKVDP